MDREAVNDQDGYVFTVVASGPIVYHFPAKEQITTVIDGDDVSYVYNDQVYSLKEILRLRNLKAFW